MRSLILHCAALLALAVCIAGVHGEAETASKARHNPGHSSQQRNVTLQLVGYTAKGTVPAGAEQVTYDDVSKVAYLIGGTNLHVIDVSPAAVDVTSSTAKILPVLATRELPSTITDVYMCGDLLAVSAEGATKVSPGQVLLYSRYLRAAGTGAESLKLLANFTVGALPDQIEFSKNCRTILVSNEGEPDCYDKPECADPEGSVSVITLRAVYTSSNGKRCKSPRVAAAADGDARANHFSRQCTLTSVEGTVRTAGFSAWNDKRDQLVKQGVILDAPNGASVAQDLEPEYTTFSADEKVAFVSIQEANAMAILDVAAAKITAIFPVGFKNHSLALNPLDPSDKDGGANIGSWPVLGMYQADEIKAFSSRGVDYVVAANEGDERDWPGYKQGARLKDIIDKLDPAVFPNAKDTIGKDAQLGRLNVYAQVNALTDADGNGLIDRILVNGARSFSIYKADRSKLGRYGSAASAVTGLTPVFDSAAQLEQLSLQLLPDVFNSEGTNETFDGRSDNKGPEPEGLAIGEIPGSSRKSPSRRILFLGTERLSVIFVYDITDPSKPVFQSIATSPRPDVNDFSTWLTGPEGFTFDYYTASGIKGKAAAAEDDDDSVDVSSKSRTTSVPIVLVAYEGDEHGGMALYRVAA